MNNYLANTTEEIYRWFHILNKKYFDGDSDEKVKYDNTGMPYISYDTAATNYFKEALQVLYLTQYNGTLTESEQADALANAQMLMRLSVKLRQNNPNASPYSYVYEFYRCDVNRIMVRLYQADENGNMVTDSVSDFYLTNLAFKKLVFNFYKILNAKVVNNELPYPD